MDKHACTCMNLYEYVSYIYLHMYAQTYTCMRASIHLYVCTYMSQWLRVAVPHADCRGSLQRINRCWLCLVEIPTACGCSGSKLGLCAALGVGLGR